MCLSVHQWTVNIYHLLLPQQLSEDIEQDHHYYSWPNDAAHSLLCLLRQREGPYK